MDIYFSNGFWDINSQLNQELTNKKITKMTDCMACTQLDLQENSTGNGTANQYFSMSSLLSSV